MGESPLSAAFSGRLVKMGASEGPRNGGVSGLTTGPFPEKLPRGPDRGASHAFRVVDPRHRRARASANVIRKASYQWSDGAATVWCLHRRFSASVCSGPPGRCVLHGCRRILVSEHPFLHHCRGLCAAGPAFSSWFMRKQIFAGVMTLLNVEIWWVRGAVDPAAACGSQVMEKCRDDPVCTVPCRCLTGNRDCQADESRARGAPCRPAIVDVLVPPIQEQIAQVVRVFPQTYILSACRADCVPSCFADFGRDRGSQVFLESACSDGP